MLDPLPWAVCAAEEAQMETSKTVKPRFAGPRSVPRANVQFFQLFGELGLKIKVLSFPQTLCIDTPFSTGLGALGSRF